MKETKQRQIKFRAWDEIAKTIIYDVTVYGCSDHIGFGHKQFVDAYTGKNNKHVDCEPYGDTSMDWYGLEDSFRLMQYTGLKDKDGVEIYEGDVVRMSRPKHNFLRTVIVKWSYALLATFRESIWELKVLGNIYENPGLLEKK